MRYSKQQHRKRQRERRERRQSVAFRISRAGIRQRIRAFWSRTALARTKKAHAASAVRERRK